MNQKKREPKNPIPDHIIEIRECRTGRRLANYNITRRRFEFYRAGRLIHFVYAELQCPIDKDAEVVYTETD